MIILFSYLGETHGAKAGVGRDVDAEHIDVMWRRGVGGDVKSLGCMGRFHTVGILRKLMFGNHVLGRPGHEIRECQPFPSTN